jgi:SAM-dependent methyltransferase
MTSDADKVFGGRIPAVYERFLGPLMFEPYAWETAQRLAPSAPAHLLETAAGTGIVTRVLAARLAPSCAIVATDLNPAMLAEAAERVKAPNVTFQQADAQALPFSDSVFEALVCQFGVMFFPDKAVAYGEAARVLKPGGRFLFSVWGSLAHNPLPTIVQETVAELFPDDPPGFLPRTPYGYHDEAVIAHQLGLAGFTGIAIETLTKPCQAPAARDVAIGFCQGTPLRGEIETRDPNGIAAATERVAQAIAERYGKGAIEATMTALIVSADAPGQ